MSEQSTPEISVMPARPPSLQETYSIATELRNRNLSDPTIIRELESRGVPSVTARNIVRNLKAAGRNPGYDARYEGDAGIHEEAMKQMGIGAVVCIIGIVVTVLSYGAVAKTGGSYVIAWGAVVFGALRFVRGLSMYNNS